MASSNNKVSAGVLRQLMTGCALVPVLAAAAVGCGDSSDDKGDAPAGFAPDIPLYATVTTVSNTDGANAYVKIIDSLGSQELDLSQALEFPGWSDMRVHAGWVFVSSGEEPTVKRFSLNAKGGLEENGSIGFGMYSNRVPMYSQILLSPTKAYLVTEDNKYVVWNPTTLEITGTIDIPNLEVREGVAPFIGFDRGAVLRGNRLFHTVEWTDFTTFKTLPDSRILVVDVDTDTVLNVLEVPCPDLDGADMDEKGDIYFSNWTYSPGETLVLGGAKACAVRIAAGSEEVDPTWKVTFAEVTGGHEGGVLRHLGNGVALTSVFYEDNQPTPAADKIGPWVFGANWKFQTLDLTTKGMKEVASVGWHSGGYHPSWIDETMYVLVPGADSSSTVVYKMGSDGTAEPTITTAGWATRLYRVR